MAATVAETCSGIPDGSSREDNLDSDEYIEGERILAYHGALLYEAKILKTEMREDPATKTPKQYYLLHYQGWNDRWDEWVDTNRMMKYNDANRKLQDDLKTEHKRAAKRAGAGKSGNLSDSKIKKRKTEKAVVIEARFKLDLPLNIKTFLVEDHQHVRKKYLVSLPRTPSIAEIFKGFLEHQTQSLSKNSNTTSTTESNQNGSTTNATNAANNSTASSNNRRDKSSGPSVAAMSEVLTALRSYFDKALGTLLLYRFERYQYSQLLSQSKSKSLSEIYGMEHLLRLFVKIPMLFAEVQMEEETLHTVKTTLIELVHYVGKMLPSVNTAYEAATPQYIRQAT